MFAESGAAKGRRRTPFKQKLFFPLPFLPRRMNEEYRADARGPSASNPANNDFEQNYTYIYIYIYLDTYKNCYFTSSFTITSSFTVTRCPILSNYVKWVILKRFGTIFERVVFGNFGDIDFSNFGAIDFLEDHSLPPGGPP